MKKIKEVISFCYGNDVVRYVFFGGCTTLVNVRHCVIISGHFANLSVHVF